MTLNRKLLLYSVLLFAAFVVLSFFKGYKEVGSAFLTQIVSIFFLMLFIRGGYWLYKLLQKTDISKIFSPLIIHIQKHLLEYILIIMVTISFLFFLKWSSKSSP